MSQDISHKLIVAISSRALFDLTESNRVFETLGVEQYARYQIEHENEILQPGVAFLLVKKFLNLNQYGDLVEVILLSRNSADTGLRIFNSIEHYGLAITRAAFSGGQSPYQYVSAFGAHLFLSANPQDVSDALNPDAQPPLFYLHRMKTIILMNYDWLLMAMRSSFLTKLSESFKSKA